MEKKISISPKFLLLSSVNVVAAIIMAGGDLYDSLALIGVLTVLILNHITLKMIVYNVSISMTESGANAQRALRKTLFLMLFKLLLIVSVVAAIYLYKEHLTLKVLLLMIFQLIIQVVSIKNNYQNS